MSASHKRFQLLALGDSYTIGESVEPEERWPVQLVERLHKVGIQFDNPMVIATTGWTTDELAAGIEVAKPRGVYDLVTLMIGVNNQFRGRPEEEYREQFEALLKGAIGFAGHRPGRVLVISIPDWGVTPFAEGRDRTAIGAEIDRLNAINKTLAEGAGARYVEVTGISREAATDNSLLAADGLHPSGKMYAEWVDLIWLAARAALAAS